MKRLFLNRKQILRAVRAAAIAYLFAVSAARAQTATGDGNGNVTISGSGTEYVYNGSNPTLAPGGNLTVANGSTITDAGHRAIIDITEGANISNAGNLTLNITSAPNYIAPVYTTGGPQSTVITNSGSLSGNVSSSGHSAGIYYNDLGASTAAVSVANAGSISASGGIQSSSAIYIISGGNVSITNTNSGTLSSFNTGHAYVLSFSAGGSGTVLNQGAITASGGAYAADINVNSTGDLSVTNAGTLQGLGATRSGSGIYAYSASGNLLVNNSGAINTGSSGTLSFYYTKGINAFSPNGNNAIANSGSISAIANGGTAAGIYVESSTGSSSVTNSASLYVKGPGIAYGIGTQSGYYPTMGLLSINNTGPVTVVSNSGYAAGLFATTVGDIVFQSADNPINVLTNSGTAYGMAATTTAGTIQIENASPISSISTGGEAYGLYANSSGASSITNSATITANGLLATTGIVAQSNAGNASITNSGSVSVTSGTGGANGLSAITTGLGAIVIINSGNVTATSNSTSSTSSAIYANSGGGTVEIDNNGYAKGSDTGVDAAYGICDVGGVGVTIDNRGSAIGTTSGIYLNGAGTVNNDGFASGENSGFSIYVKTESTVNLNASSSVQGLIKGGVDDSSSSLLNFNLAIIGNHLASDRTALDVAIAQYEAALAAAPHGPGHDVDSIPVELNGATYQWEDFASIFDNLVQGRLYGQTQGYASLGGVLDNLPSNPTANQLLAALNNLPDSAVAAALGELSPKELEIFRNIAFDNNTFNVADINNHLANLRDGLTGFDSSGLTIQDPGMDPTLNDVRSHLLAYNPTPFAADVINDSASGMFGGVDTKNSEAITSAPADRWSSFISGNVILADLSNNPLIDDSNYTTGTVLAGADYRLDQHFTVGALFGYSHTGADLDSRGSSATVDSYTPGIYASYVNGGWYANALGSYTRNAYTEDRNIDIVGLSGINHGSSGGNQGSVNFTGGYEFQQGSFKFGPIATVQYVHLSTDSINEGGPTALTIADQNEDSFRTLLGFEGRFTTAVATPYGRIILTPHLSASWQHEYLDNSDGITASFNGTGGGSFNVQTDTTQRESAFVDVGLDATLSKNVTLFVDYQTQAGQDNFFAQSAQGGIRIGF